MIQINENYRIDGTKHDYLAQYRIPATERKKEQEDSWGLVGYYDSIERAVAAILDHEYRRRIHDNEYDLKSAVEEYRNTRKEFSELLRRTTIPEFQR